MNPEEIKLIKRIAQQVEENNEILQNIQSSMRWAKIWRAVYWTIIVGTSVGAYWFVQPYINQVLDIYTGAQTNLNTVKGLLDVYKN